MIQYSDLFGFALSVAQPQGRPSIMFYFPMFGIMLLIMYFLIWKPQQKKQQDHQSMLESMKKGDKVVTVGGIHGVLIGVKNNIAVIKISENTKIEINRGAIASVESKK